MTKIEQALKTFPTLAPDQQESIADVIIDAALPVIEFSAKELGKIDVGTQEAEAGSFASDSDVVEVYARYR